MKPSLPSPVFYYFSVLSFFFSRRDLHQVQVLPVPVTTDPVSLITSLHDVTTPTTRGSRGKGREDTHTYSDDRVESIEEETSDLELVYPLRMVTSWRSYYVRPGSQRYDLQYEGSRTPWSDFGQKSVLGQKGIEGRGRNGTKGVGKECSRQGVIYKKCSQGQNPRRLANGPVPRLSTPGLGPPSHPLM